MSGMARWTIMLILLSLTGDIYVGTRSVHVPAQQPTTGACVVTTFLDEIFAIR